MEFKLEHILPNPWQPRLGEDAEHIKELALSIHRDGLMQIPVGRLVDANEQPCELNEAYQQAGAHDSAQELWDEILGVMGCRIQLAFGHSRLAAYQWLRDVKDWSDLRGDWSRMPVILRDLGDETMARMAIEENVQRKDLNPIEEGMAMQRLRNDFQMTAAQVGEIFGLADSSVRNKMRLLELPPAAMDALKRGEMSEGTARELLRFYELPADLQRRTTVRKNGSYYDTESAAEAAMRGALPAADLRNTINQTVTREGHNLHEAPWKWDQVFDLALDPDLKAATCKGCSFQMELEKRTYCIQPSCYFGKRVLWIKARLAKASAVCGIPPVDEVTHQGIRVSAEVRGSGCANLRVVFREPQSTDEREALVPGFGDCMVVCGNRNSICTCANGLAARQAAVERARIAEAERARRMDQARTAVEHIAGTTSQVVTRTAPEAIQQAAPTSEELREAAREEKRSQKAAEQELEALREEFARRVRNALLKNNRWAWGVLVAGEWDGYLERQREKYGTIEESAYKAGMKLAISKTTYYGKINLEWERKRLNELLERMELIPIELPADPDEPVYVPVEEAVQPAASAIEGKRLIEVFEEEGGEDAGAEL